ncbi:MAG: hypothetical protein ABL895_19085 [Cyclobacteriaceae bacterium]
MSKKPIYLLLALILPIGVFVFLRMFGKNEFTIPVYYEQGVTDMQPSCGYTYPVPYSIPDSIMHRIGWAADKSVVLLVADTSTVVDIGLKRLWEEFESTDFQLVYPTGELASWDHWYSCFFFLKRPWSAVLIDSDKRIRGYYAPNSREEVDRLIVEMKILLKKY